MELMRSRDVVRRAAEKLNLNQKGRPQVNEPGPIAKILSLIIREARNAIRFRMCCRKPMRSKARSGWCKGG